MPRENTIVGAITRELTRRGAYWINVHGAGVGRNGVPDLLACHHGQFIAVEVKQRRGRVRALQTYELERVQKAGGHALVARDLTGLRAVLDQIEEQT